MRKLILTPFQTFVYSSEVCIFRRKHLDQANLYPISLLKHSHELGGQIREKLMKSYQKYVFLSFALVFLGFSKFFHGFLQGKDFQTYRRNIPKPSKILPLWIFSNLTLETSCTPWKNNEKSTNFAKGWIFLSFGTGDRGATTENLQLPPKKHGFYDRRLGG